MLKIILATYDNENDAITHGMVGSAKIIEFSEDLEELVEGCPCCLIIDKFGKDEYSLAELCVTTIRKKIGDKGSFKLVMSKQAFAELTPVQKMRLYSNCTKYLVFIRAVGRYSIYRVCNDLDCTEPTYAVYCGGFLVTDGLAPEKDADSYIKSILQGEKSGKTIDDALKDVEPTKPKGLKWI